jgi:hypothetical protein
MDVAVIAGSGSIDIVKSKAAMFNRCVPDDKTIKGNWVAIIGSDANHECSYCDRMVSAYELGAKAIIFYGRPGNTKGYPHGLPPSPSGCVKNKAYTSIMSEMGIVSVSDQAAFILLQLMNKESKLKITLSINSKYKTVMTRNVIAESKKGRSDSIVLFGSHLDSGP